MTEYDYIQTVNTSQIKDEMVTAGLPLPSDIQINDVTVSIFYPSDLSEGQKNTLDSVVANHVANSSYVTLAVKAQIAQLVGYLNNASPTVANTARAVMVANIAPKLPPNLVYTINLQIAGIVGF